MSIYPVGFVVLENLKSLHDFVKEEIFKKKPPVPLSEFPTDEEVENLTADYEEVKREVGEEFKPSPKEKEKLNL
jgi:hypothetical protein